MDERAIPQSLRIALNVTDAEYRKARLQSKFVWLATLASAFVAGGLWWAGLRLTGWIRQITLAAVGTYLIANWVMPEARKAGTGRLRKYRELQRYRSSLEKLKARGGYQGDAGVS
jgi:hypothetical protein